jgi:CubicO group peptidase (beta-lactamase class C family)
MMSSNDPAHTGSKSNANADWQRVPPQEAGFDSGITKNLEQAASGEQFRNLHAVVVVRGGKLVAEHYYEGRDECWGQELGVVKFSPNHLHDLRSVSKSIVGLLYGIALEAGKVPTVDQPLIKQFPEYAEIARDPERQRMLVSHALTMQLGIQWNEELPYTDPSNSEIAMEMADDRYRFVLEQPFAAQPGEQWNYNGGCTALLGHLIARGTRMSISNYARKVLFNPLGIKTVKWSKGSDRVESAASGLRLRPRELAKIGQMVLNKGRWGDRQVAPEHWLNEILTPRIQVDEEIAYGYQWWLGKSSMNGEPWYAGFGNGGQCLIVIPSLHLVVVIMAGNYNQADARQIRVAVMNEIIMPAIISD